MAEVDNIKRHAINFMCGCSIFIFNLEDKTLNEEERCNRKEQSAKKRKSRLGYRTYGKCMLEGELAEENQLN